MVLFQNRIIYMPGIPLGARKEQISDYKGLLRGIRWTKESLHTSDGKTLAATKAEVRSQATNKREKHIVVIYFQGFLHFSPCNNTYTNQHQQRIIYATSSPLSLLSRFISI